jgi:hypothetical protein
MMKILAGLLGLFMLSQIATARTRAEAAQGSANNEVPFELVSGYLVVVEGNIGSLHGLKFLLDTGTTHSVVSTRIADWLQLQRVTGKVFNLDRMTKTDWAAIPEIEFGPIHATQVAVMVTNLDYFKGSTSYVDVVIGLDLLHLKNFSIDFVDKKVRFGPVETGRHSIPMSSDGVSLNVEAVADGRLIHLILDSGAPGPLMYEERLESRAVDYSVGQEEHCYRLDGILRLTRARVRRLQLGGSDIDHTILLMHSPGKGVMDGIDGLLGLAALKARRINFNFVTDTFSWTN